MSEIKNKALEYTTKLMSSKPWTELHPEFEIHIAQAFIDGSELHAQEIAQMKTAIDEGKEREKLAAKLINDKRKECESLEKQLQELKDKAVEAHRLACPYIAIGAIIDGQDLCNLNAPNRHDICKGRCKYVNLFITELNK